MSTVGTEVLPRLKFESAGVPLTPEEFDAITDYDENYNYELIHGGRIGSPPPGASERSPNGLLGHWLNKFRFEHPQGTRLVETLYGEYLKSSGNRRRVDRVVWTVIEGKPQDPRVDLPAIAIE